MDILNKVFSMIGKNDCVNMYEAETVYCNAGFGDWQDFESLVHTLTKEGVVYVKPIAGKGCFICKN
jgi:hypothetical protein